MENQTTLTINEIRGLSLAAGKYFFRRDTDEFWKTEYVSRVYESNINDNLFYFITSEHLHQMTEPERKSFKIRVFNKTTCCTQTAPGTAIYNSKKEALKDLTDKLNAEIL